MLGELTKTRGAKNRKVLIIWSLIWAAVISCIMYIGLLVFPNNILGNSLQLIHLEECEKELNELEVEHVQLEVIPKKKDSYENMVKLLKETEGRILSMDEKMVELEEKRARIKQQYLDLQEEYKEYYKVSQQKLWKGMEGKETFNIRFKDGTPVEDVTIRDFAPSGIRVKKGYSYRTIKVSELSDKTIDRYLLGVSDLERFMEEQGDITFSMD